MKGLIIYKGRYGATKQYAIWLGEQLRLSVASADRFPIDELPKYDFFIIGYSVYIGKLEIKEWLKDNVSLLQKKKIFLFQVAGTPVEQKIKREKYNITNVPAEILNKCETYFLPGRMIIRNLSWFDKFMLKMGARLTKDPDEKERMLTDFDHIKKEYLTPLIEDVRRFIGMHEPEPAHI